MLSQNGSSLLLVPYLKRDFKSHSVPEKVYNGLAPMDVHSLKLCQIIAKIHGWDIGRSYRVPGSVWQDQEVVIFDLLNAWKIG